MGMQIHPSNYRRPMYNSQMGGTSFKGNAYVSAKQVQKEKRNTSLKLGGAILASIALIGGTLYAASRGKKVGGNNGIFKNIANGVKDIFKSMTKKPVSNVNAAGDIVDFKTLKMTGKRKLSEAPIGRQAQVQARKTGNDKLQTFYKSKKVVKNVAESAEEAAKKATTEVAKETAKEVAKTTPEAVKKVSKKVATKAKTEVPKEVRTIKKQSIKEVLAKNTPEDSGKVLGTITGTDGKVHDVISKTPIQKSVEAYKKKLAK